MGLLSRSRPLRLALISVGLLGAALAPYASADNTTANTADAVERGAYIYALGGCESCHTDSENDGAPLAGGLAMQTPFGTFHTPNISPDPQHGIGGWSQQQFNTAMREGLSPDGEHYYPAFPYTAYTRMTEADLSDLKAYLDAQQPVAQPNREHDLSFPFSMRSLLAGWKWLHFTPQRFVPFPTKSDGWNRGAYIVTGPGHCGECHTPRGRTGGLERDLMMAGNPEGPDGEAVPGLRISTNRPFRMWDADDIAFALETGMKPDGDFLGGSMGHVIDNSTSKLTEADRQAIAEYLIDIRR